MNMMKKKRIAFFVLWLFLALSASAQDAGRLSAGIDALYGTYVKSMGIGVKVRYGFSNTWRAEGAYSHFFKKDGITMQGFSVHGQYLLPAVGCLQAYPLAGLCLTHVKYDNMPTRYEDGGFIAVEKETHIGAAAGVGVDLTITPHLILNAQGLYQIVKNNHQGVFSIGVIYKF